MSKNKGRQSKQAQSKKSSLGLAKELSPFFVNHCGADAAIIPPGCHKPALISRLSRNYIETWARGVRHEPDTGACQNRRNPRT
ncbi:hypothetical protein [Mesorhizobium sp. CN2-181]|uniref:hypothetical protein n=1 Tax=Mesorhizobium yinganensis TaxID=3157707 RepID=UPI0032B72C41